ncbi:hypothetical protein TNCV_3627901 [Trichonephila clavipes]|nr:hypothetical protein TNCV_3627901 [Trichonephila clavipes]
MFLRLSGSHLNRLCREERVRYFSLSLSTTPTTPTTACNRLQPPTTACNRLQPPTTACNRLQPPAPPAPPLQQNRLFLPTHAVYFEASG